MARKNSGNTRAVIFIVIGLVASAAATVVIWELVEKYQARIAEAQKPEETVTVLVATRELFQGLMITEEDVHPVEVPPAYLPGVDEAEFFDSVQDVVGSYPRERILPNEVLRPDRLADSTSGVGLNATLREGLRAISIGVKDGQALSGLLNPGDLVDVVVTIDPDDGDKEAVTRTIVQAVYVLAVNDRTSNTQDDEEDDGKPKRRKKRGGKRLKPSVTLAVFPDQAEEIAHAEKEGEITLTLRNAQDREYREGEIVNRWDVLGREPLKPEKPAPKPVVKTVAPEPEPEEEKDYLQIIKGTKSEQVEIEKESGAVQP